MKTIAQQLNIKKFPFAIKDKNGKEIYFERRNGYWIKTEFDSNGKEIYYEDSFGYWYKYEFDSNGNEIYLKIQMEFGANTNTIPMEIKSTMKIH
jgi:hypothetical protein